MTEKCQICGNKAGYFTDTYSPKTEKMFVIYLCKKHQQLICELVIWGVQTKARAYKRGERD